MLLLQCPELYQCIRQDILFLLGFILILMALFNLLRLLFLQDILEIIVWASALGAILLMI